MASLGWYIWIGIGALITAGSKLMTGHNPSFYKMFFYIGVVFMVFGGLKLLLEIFKLKPKKKKSRKKHTTTKSLTYCDSCGTKNHNISNYCHKCGNKLKHIEIEHQEHFTAKP